MRSIDRWIRQYDQMRVEPYRIAKEHLSSRFDLSGLSWNEIREIPIPELINPKTGEPMTFGTSFEALRKTWYALKRSTSLLLTSASAL